MNGESRTVYRVEDRFGQGPFSSGHSRDFHQTPAFRAPREEPRLRARWYRGALDDHFCGFSSLDEARRWFPEEMVPELEEDGFEITEWRVPRRDIAFGRDQVMFNRDAADCVSRLPIKSIHNKGDQP